jgi:sugar O-acyltransferase (sialic acid O-acetyltransferase NeuD family)
VRLALAVNAGERRFERLLVLDDDPAKRGRRLLGVEVAGGLDLLAEADPGGSRVANLVARTTARRAAARARIAAHGVPFAPLVSPRVDTFGAELARDVIVYPNATIGPEVTLAEGAVVFTGGVVGHECRVGAGCVVAANAVLNARVELAEGVYVGTNATVLPEVKVGAWATVGAGSVVLEDVAPGTTVMGVPARALFAAPGAAPPPASPPEALADPELERRLRRIFEDVLGVAEVDAGTNFFELGGSSLLALRVGERVERELGRRLEPTDLYRLPTLRALARHLRGARHPSSGLGARRGALRREMLRRLAEPRLSR